MSSVYGQSTLQQLQTIIPEQVRNEAGVIFPLKFESTGPGDYEVTLLPSNSHEQATATFRWELATRAAEMTQLEQVRSAMREGRADSTSIETLAALGRRLYGFVFNGKLAEELDRARSSADRVYVHLYLHPDLDDAPGSTCASHKP